MKKMLLAFAFAWICGVASGKDIRECTLGICVPFRLNRDAQQIPDTFESELDGAAAIPQKYIEYLKSKNLFKDVIEIKRDEAADYYVHGYIESVGFGNGAARYWAGSFGKGLAHLKLKVITLNSKRKPMGREDIFRKGKLSRFVWSPGAWSKTVHLQSAVEATQEPVFNLILKSIVGIDGAGAASLLSSRNSEVTKRIAKQVANGLIPVSTNLERAFASVIDEHILHPVEDEKAIDALAWVCVAIGSANMTNNAGDVEKLAAADVGPKIHKYAVNALTMLNP